MERVGKYLKFVVAVVLAFSLSAPFCLEVKANDPQTGTSTEHYEVRWDKPQLNDTNGYINVFSEDVNTGERFVETFYWNIAPQNDYYLPDIPSYMDITVGAETIRFDAKIGMDLDYEDNLNFKLTILRYHGRGLSVIKSATCADSEHTSFIYNDGLDIGRRILGYYVYGNVGIVTDDLGTNKDNNFTVTYGVTADSNPYNIYTKMLEIMLELDKNIEDMELILTNQFDMSISAFSNNIQLFFLNLEKSLNDKLDEVIEAIVGDKKEIQQTTDSLNDKADDLKYANNELDNFNYDSSINVGLNSILNPNNDTFLNNSSFLNTAFIFSNALDNIITSNPAYELLIITSLTIGIVLLVIGKKV